jgi:carboxypeptidase family protein/TonB-dependent receptor-like protein
MRARTLAALMAVLLFAWPVAAQEQRGSIEGVIKDSSGAVLPGVTVEAKSPAGTFTSVTDAQGIYRFPSLAPGQYDVSAALAGFQPAKTDRVLLSLGQVLKVDMAMQLAGVTESVQVSAESPLIDLKQSAAGATIRSELIDRVPKGRDFTSLVTLAPGASQESRGGGISIDGASGSENRFFIDGVDTTNLQTGVSGKNFLVDFIDQIQVKSSGYAAEFGGSTGGVINVISKSGTNEFRGEVGTYFTGDSMCCNERPTQRLVLTGLNQDEYVTFPEDKYSRWEPFGQLGGPLLSDKLWFYGAVTPQVERTERTVTFRSNQQTSTYKMNETTNYYSGNLTGQLTHGLRTRVSANYGKYDQDGRLPAKDGSSNFLTNFVGLGQERPNLGVNGTVDYVAGNNLFFNARGNYLSYNTIDSGVPDDVWITFSQGSNGLFPGATNVQPTGYNSVLTNRASVKDLFQRMGFSADTTYYAHAGGQHTFKGGVQFERIRNDVFNAEQAPHVTFNWDASRSALDGRVLRGTYGYYSWRQFGTIGDVRVNNLGLFIQDNWTVNNKLTLNLGIRTEKEEIPSYVEGLQGIKFSFADKFAPRVGFAYDVQGNGKWKAFGSWGVFYDVMKLELPRGAFGGDKWIEHYYTLNTLDYLSIGQGGNFPGTFIEDVDFRIPSNDPACPECGAIDSELKPMRQQEVVGGIEHELNPTLSVGMRYVHKQIDRGIEDVGVLVPGIGEVFYIANPGESAATFILADECPTCPSLPKVKRDYDAVELKLEKRYANRWSGNVNYTYSRLYGNYSGLASSDENGRTSPNVNRFFDSLPMAFGSDGKPVFGLLNTDRPHALKVNGFYQLPTNTSVGLAFQVKSGIPISRVTNMQSSTPVFFAGRLSDGRTPVFSQTDLQVQQEFRLVGRARAQFLVNVINLFDQDTTLDVFRNYLRDIVPITNEAFFAGFDIEQILVARPTLRKDPRFLKASAFQGARAVRVGVKLTF